MSETKIIPTTGRNNCGGRCIIYAHVCDGVIEKPLKQKEHRSILFPYAPAPKA